MEIRDDLELDRPLTWAPKVNPGKIRRLYMTYASRGIIDEEQINDVGYALHARCHSIWCVTERRCPECTTALDTVKVDMYSCLACSNCGWAIRKRRFTSSYKRKRLVGGSAYPAFKEFLGAFESAKNPQAKMIAIDNLIHAFHGDYQGERARLRRTACVSVLEGSDEELKKMLEDLAYGDNVDSRMRENKIEWCRKKTEASKAKANHAK